jgi:predicted lipoprotein with Yx(FWY)xxD motif
MQHPRIMIASVGVAVLAAAGGITAAVASTSTASAAPAASHSASVTAVRTLRVPVNGKFETILVSATGQPLYYYQPDTAATSMVSGGLAAAWPPLTAASPTAAGISGQLTAVMDTHGSQVAYNGHLLYTFITDKPGQVTGQGVQNFFVVTPGIAPLAGSATSPGSTPASPSGGGYGY